MKYCSGADVLDRAPLAAEAPHEEPLAAPMGVATGAPYRGAPYKEKFGALLKKIAPPSHQATWRRH